MTVEMILAAVIGGAIGLAELVARYRDKPFAALLSPGGLLFVFINASASIVALIAVTASGWTFGLPLTTPPANITVVRVLVAAIGSAAVLRMSFGPASPGTIGTGPVALLGGVLRLADGELARKRALSRLSRDDLAGLSYARDHAALAELCCHLMREFDLAEAQRLGGLAAELSHRDDLTDADKLDCWGLELTRLVGERALRQAARRLRDRPRDEPPKPEPAEEPAEPKPDPEHTAQIPPPRSPVAKTSRLAASSNGRTERRTFSDA
ncbi:hypothetical protein [Actinomadura decatromicini]|uniref:Uncharacterized protein n=1 Tax=Actinomadura decatromicini TaxID=2604572 RepID=A0A5D3FFC3_9ACTN|nr:hypothetical protein [Actinomadura decatromicini]TYK46789.1 hypothetical protein FXF68_23390 [Actinomadura decatromicini]